MHIVRIVFQSFIFALHKALIKMHNFSGVHNIRTAQTNVQYILSVAEYIEPMFPYLFAKQYKLSKQHNLKMAKQNL